MCRVFFGHVDPDPQIVGVGRRVFELAEFLVDILGVTDTGASFPHKVALHIGCHGRRELGAADTPATLLQNVRGMTCCEMPERRGVLRFRRHLQREDARHLAGHGPHQGGEHRRSGAEVVVSPDISCLMHLGGILRAIRPRATSAPCTSPKCWRQDEWLCCVELTKLGPCGLATAISDQG